MHSALRRLLPAILFLTLTAHGTVVTTSADEDNGSLGGGAGISLREAVKYSPVGDTVTFAPALSGQTIRLLLGQITISDSLTIDGSALPTRITLSGDKTGDGKTADDTRVLNITTGTVLLDSLVITGGNCPIGSAATQGGGIYVNSLTTKLTVRNSLFTANSAVSGGAIYHSGLLNSPDSIFEIHNCTFTGNTATDGGAIYGRESTATIQSCLFTGNTAADRGGAIWTRFNLLLTTCTLAGNTAQRGGGIFQFQNSLTIERSTLSANTVSSYGGGMFTSGGTSTVRNSTVAANSSTEYGGGIYQQSGNLALEFTTVSANTGRYGGGITSAGSFTANSSIIAGNSGQPPADVSGQFSGLRNIAPIFTQPAANPRLAPLGNYGGPTQTMPPLTTSTAIDRAGATTLTADQRGLPRDALPDIGAAEYQGTRNLAAPILGPAGAATLSFGTPSNTPGFAWVLSRSPDLTPGSFTEIYRYQGGADIAALGTTFVRTAAFITVTDANAPSGSGYYRIGLLLVP